MELEKAGLLEEDHWMMEVNLEDMESMTGEQEEYWLAAIKVAWLASKLTRQWADWAQWGLLQMGINFTRSTNPCEHSIGWLSVAHLTKDIVLEGEKPALVVLTAALFG